MSARSGGFQSVDSEQMDVAAQKKNRLHIPDELSDVQGSVTTGDHTIIQETVFFAGPTPNIDNL